MKLWKQKIHIRVKSQKNPSRSHREGSWARETSWVQQKLKQMLSLDDFDEQEEGHKAKEQLALGRNEFPEEQSPKQDRDL